MAAGAALALVSLAHARGTIAGGGRVAVAAALAADLLAAAGLVAWLLVADPATAALGTLVLAVVAAGLALQAAFDGLMLRQAGR